MKKLLLLLLFFIVLILLLISLFNTLTQVSRQGKVVPATPIKLDSTALAQRLSGAIAIAAVSNPVDKKISQEAFVEYRRYLKQNFSLFGSEEWQWKETKEGALLGKWEGRNHRLKPLLFIGQLDVKDPALSQLPHWTYGPFLGKSADAHVWGAGTQGGKAMTLALLEALQLQLGEIPERTVYLALCPDLDRDSARAASLEYIARLMQNSALEFEAVLGFRSFVSEGLCLDFTSPVAFIHCAEKQKIDLEITAVNTELVADLARFLEQRPLPLLRKGRASEQLMQNLIPELSFGQKWLLSNRGWIGHWSEAALYKDIILADMLYSKAQMKAIEGDKARLRWSLSPDYTPEFLKEHIQQLLPKGAFLSDFQEPLPSFISSAETFSFRALSTTIKQCFSDALVLPGIANASSELAICQELSPAVYHFSPLILRNEEGAFIYTEINQRISISDYSMAVRFYWQWIANIAMK